jgi:hypothetical protein
MKPVVSFQLQESKFVPLQAMNMYEKVESNIYYFGISTLDTGTRGGVVD